MKSKPVDLKNLKTTPFYLEETTAKMSMGEVFADRRSAYLNEFSLFLAHFNYIPNFIHETGIHCVSASKWFVTTYETEIKNLYYSKRYFDRNKKAEYDDVFFLLFDDLMVDFDTSNSIVRFLFQRTDVSKVESVIRGIRRFKERKTKGKPEIVLLVNTSFGIETKKFQIMKPKLSLEDNYNDDFMEVHQTIMKRFSMKDDKGIVLLHGKSGTGKTFYIRYLVSVLNKRVIFLPTNMARTITNPELIPILIMNPNSVFVIEDAENLLVDREKSGDSPVAALLNISDGLLSDCLNIQVICSFNTDLSMIDHALLRKGRLIANYEFRELQANKAQSLSRKLGFQSKIDSPMTLTAIYNQGEKGYVQIKSRNPIGFK